MLNLSLGEDTMHHFLRAIGFSKLRNLKQIQILLEDIVAHPTSRSITTIGAGTSFVQMTKEFGDSFGISVIGEYDESNHFILEHYFPFVLGTTPKWEESIIVEPHLEKEAYAGVSENTNIGIPLIFFLQNIADYIRTKWSNEYNRPLNQVSYGALSTDGKIILGIDKDEEQLRMEKKGQRNRNRLIAAAKEGDADAIENLTLEDIDLYSSISKRAKNEDLYSIVDSCFIPYGINSEQYSIIGTIQDIHILKNPVSEEELYQLLVEVNDIPVDILINAADLVGEPAIGRRFKGSIWIQGYVFLP